MMKIMRKRIPKEIFKRNPSQTLSGKEGRAREREREREERRKTERENDEDDDDDDDDVMKMI